MAKREDPFSRVSKSMLDDEHLSWRAKGVLSYLLGKPAGWKLRATDLMNKSKDGSRAVRAALKELRAAGYAELRPVRSGGRIIEWCWKVSDTAIFPPDVRFVDVENAHVQNAHPSKTEGSKNDLSKKGLSKESKESKETSALPTQDVLASPDETFPAMWKEDKRTKEEKLATTKVPKDYPSERTFNTFIESLDAISTYRGDSLYSELCDNKWHDWTGRNWRKIKDWKAYVMALETKLNSHHA